MSLISHKQVARIDLIANIIQIAMVSVGDDNIAGAFETLKIADNLRAEEHGTILQRWFIYDNSRTFSLYTFHNSLYR